MIPAPCPFGSGVLGNCVLRCSTSCIPAVVLRSTTAMAQASLSTSGLTFSMAAPPWGRGDRYFESRAVLFIQVVDDPTVTVERWRGSPP